MRTCARPLQVFFLGLTLVLMLVALASPPARAASLPSTTYHTRLVDGVHIFYREAGPPTAPAIVLLHGFPTSSFMYRNLIPLLAGRYHVIAPDYPGFGYSDAPTTKHFTYTFDHLSRVIEHLLVGLGVTRFSLYLQDYGAPVGLRIAVRHPTWIAALIAQNGNAYEAGLSAFWNVFRAYWQAPSPRTEAPLRALLSRATTHFQYTAGMPNPNRISPDGENLDLALLARPGETAIQLALFYDYRTNVALYPTFQAYFRRYQPPLLLVWGANDPVFPAAGARAYLQDLPHAELHLFNAGHFALEAEAPAIAADILHFLAQPR